MALSFSYSIGSIFIFKILSTTNHWALYVLHNAKHRYSTKFCVSSSFSAGPSLPGLATVSVLEAGGKPSTWFPHGGLVECLLKKIKFSKQIKNLKKILKFLKIFKNLHFFKNFRKLKYHRPGRDIDIFICYWLHINLQDTIYNIFCAFFIMSCIKTSLTRQNFALYHHFLRAQVCRA